MKVKGLPVNIRLARDLRDGDLLGSFFLQKPEVGILDGFLCLPDSSVCLNHAVCFSPVWLNLWKIMLFASPQFD